jgi:hypothetical protein
LSLLWQVNPLIVRGHHAIKVLLLEHVEALSDHLLDLSRTVLRILLFQLTAQVLLIVGALVVFVPRLLLIVDERAGLASHH